MFEEEEFSKTNNFKTKIDTLSDEYYYCNISEDKLFLEITLEAGDGFSGGGYKIDILNSRYNISPYHYTDDRPMFDFLETEKHSKLVRSKLTLDKSSYEKGDTLFGHVKFKMQIGYGSEKYFEEGEGYFKGLVN